MMILVCPECSTNYEIPTALPEKGARVRCTTCEHVWLATPADTFDPAEMQGEDGGAEAQDEAVEGAAATSGDADANAGDDAAAEDSPFDEEIPAIAPGDEEFDELDFSDVETDANSQDDIDDLFEVTADEGQEAEEADDAEEDASLASLFDDDEEEEDDGEAETVEAAVEPDAREELEAAGENSGSNSQDDIDGLFDEPEGGEENSQDDIDGLFDADGEDEANSQDDIDGLFDDVEAPSDEEQLQADDAVAEKPPADPADEDLAAQANEDAPETAVADDSDSEEELIDPFDGVDFGEEENSPAGDMAAALPIWKRIDRNAAIGWGCYGLALLAVVVLAVSMRVQVVRVAPAMASIYKVLGMPVNVRGVMFTNVQQRWQPNGDKLQLQVEGEIANLTNSYKALPHVVVGALSDDRREVFRWVVNVRKKPLLPGEKAPFVAEIPAPPEFARHLVLRFEE